jgi:Uncharacterized protein conserved in bacteria
MENERLLIVNADDFGMNDAATEGIIESHLAGTVTSTTLMVNGHAVGRAADLATRNPGLGVGLHFNLTWGRPVAGPRQVPALVGDDGLFLPREKLAWRLLSGRVPAEQIQAELKAQVARFQELGLQMTHVDSHQHVHAFGRVFDAVAGHCRESRIPMRVPWVSGSQVGSAARRVRRAALAGLLARVTRRWRADVRSNDGLGSVFDLGTPEGPFGDEEYREILRSADGQAFELMVHPVSNAREMEGYTRIGKVGEAEWRYLRSGRLAGIAREEGFHLGNFRDLAG